MKSKVLTPCYYHPTTVALVDDHKSFLAVLLKQLSNKLSCKGFTDPKKMISHVDRFQISNTVLNGLMDNTQDYETGFLSSHLEVDKIRKIAGDPRRFENVTCAVIDYAMPVMNGLEVCAQLNSDYLRKIMLTAEADNSIAVNAFNQGLIHKFYIKDSKHFLDTFTDEIYRLQEEYFADLTQLLISESVYEQYPVMNCLKDKTFSDYFKKLREQYNIVEYYLTDTEGGFILYSSEGGRYYLSVKTSHEMSSYSELATYSSNTDTAIINALEKCQKVPYFLTQENLEQPPENWEPYLHPATKIDGQLTYYIAFIEDNAIYDETDLSVSSFASYLQTAEKS